MINKPPSIRAVAFGLVMSALIVSAQAVAKTAVGEADLRCEYTHNPLGIDTPKPHLSWKMQSDVPGQKQTAYRILVASSQAKLDKDVGDLWDSGKIPTDQSLYIAYSGKPLQSKMECYWKVKVWDKDGKATPWSETAQWVMGYLSPDDWTAKWIQAPDPIMPNPEHIRINKATYRDDKGKTSIDVTQRIKKMVAQKQKIVVYPKTFEQARETGKYVLDLDYDLKGQPIHLVVKPNRMVDFSGESKLGKAAPHFRKEFDLSAVPETAHITVNAAAFFEVYVNGQKIGKDVLTPAQSRKDKRTFSVTYDVQPYLKKGANCIGLWIGHWQGPFSSPLIIRAQLDAVIGGKPLTLGTDTTWLSRNSGRYTTDDGGFGGELIDARRRIPAWSEVGLATDGWRAAEETSGYKGMQLNQNCPLNRLGNPIPVKSVTELGDGSYEIDFGTNLTGWFRMQMPQLKAGDKVTLTFADSKKNKRNKGKGYQTFGQVSGFISAGQPGEVFQHKFNYAGFQYVIVKGLPQAPKKTDAVAMLIDSDLEMVGAFECSNDLFNRIFHLNEWTQRCLNLGGYSVDCPHRERKGYGGDGQTPVEGYLTSFRADGFYRKWLMDWKDVQGENGDLPNTAPQGFGGGGPAWGGFVAAITWRHYLYYGDRRILEENYETVRKYVGHLEAISEENRNILTGKTGRFSFIGDWVAPGRGMDSKNMPSHEAREIFNNCYRIYHMQLYMKMAEVLGQTDEVDKYQKVIEKIRPLIHKEFYDEDLGTYVYDQQAYYILPLMTGVVPDNLRARVLRDLETNILVTRKGHLDTGLLGTYFMMEYLREIGRNDLVFTMFSKTTYPGWGYMLEQGATTVWEQWNGYWSHIHSCFPSANNWLYQGLAGIQADPQAPGFKNVIIKPDPVGDVSWIRAHHDSPYGRISSQWKREGKRFTLKVTIPPNSTGTIYVPASSHSDVLVNGEPVVNNSFLSFIKQEQGRAVFNVAPGTYTFAANMD